MCAGFKSISSWKPLTDWRVEDRVMRRDQIQLTTEATHQLESQGQALSAGTKSGSLWNSHPEEPRTGVVSMDQKQLTTEATYPLESRGQALFAGTKYSSPWKPLTHWRAKVMCHEQGSHPAYHGNHSLSEEPRTGIISRVQIQVTTKATHILESRGQLSSAGSKSRSPQKPLTSWRAKDRHCEQGPNAAYHRSHSLPGEPRTCIMSRVKIQLSWKPLTTWRAENTCCEQGPNPAHHGIHSPPGEPRTHTVSRVQTQLTTESTHFLESQGHMP